MSTLQVDTINDSSGNLNPTLVAGTAQATTSGTEFDFTGIPAGVKRITVVLDQVSLSGTDSVLVQIGDSGGIETTGYVAGSGQLSAGGQAEADSTNGFPVYGGNAAASIGVNVVIVKSDTNDWVSSHSGHWAASAIVAGGGVKTLSDTLTQVRVTTSGANTFDGGQVNILYE